MARLPFMLCDEFLFTEDGGCFTVSNQESRHLSTVLRAREGYRFIAFNGAGKSCLAEIVEASRGKINAKVLERLEDESPPEPFLILAVGVVKGNRMDWAIEKAAETGVHSFIPLLTEFSVVDPKDGKIDRWHGIALAAAKQSRRKWLMQIHQPIEFDDLLNDCVEIPTVLLDTATNCMPVKEFLNTHKISKGLRLIIGPEGGFSEAEIARCQSLKLPIISIGSHPLRTETAVAVSAGIIMAQSIISSP